MKIQGPANGGSAEIGHQDPRTIPGVPGPAAALPFALMTLKRRKRA